ncbi:MAG: hypothetical protein KDF60_17930 [Calditrichaeota bacterium]|nr:hypothetical protein [Calditrichota bacterium]
MAKQKYLVIIGDIVKSREIQDRQKFQQRFKDALKDTSAIFDSQAIVSQFVVTIGDEFQGILKQADKIFHFINALEDRLSPLNFRYGLGMGTISTTINKEAAIGMDGPAFYNARTSLETAKKDNLFYCFKSGSDKDDTLNMLLSWLSREKEKWPLKKRKIIGLADAGKTQKQIAADLNITQPAVSKTLNMPAVSLASETEKMIENEINKILKD